MTPPPHAVAMARPRLSPRARGARRVQALARGVAAVLAVGVAARADAQTSALQGRALGAPVGIAVPALSVAGAEEPTALEVNPAGTGFVGGPALHLFHQGRGSSNTGGEGLWASVPLGPLVPTLAMQWIHPGDLGGAHFRRTTLGLALSDHRTVALGAGWTHFSSPDGALDALSALDLGLTVRPSRHLSAGVAVRDLGARLGGTRLPVRYDLGLATRLAGDGLTLAADLLSNDQGRGDLQVDAAAFAAAVELGQGLAVAGQIQVPVATGRSGPAASVYGGLALTWNAPHAGLTVGGGAGEQAGRTWLVGARLSAERYRASAEPRGDVPRFEVADLLAGERSVLGGERDPYAALLRRLAEARDDPSVPAVALRLEALPVGPGRADELRALVADIAARKPVLAYVTGGGLRELYVASAASLVAAPPTASFFPLGLASTTPFLAEALSKVGVSFDVVAAGRFKSAPEPLVRRDMSEPAREVANRLLDDVYGREVGAIAAARRLEPPAVRAAVDEGVLSAEEARAARLVDATAWPDELDELLSARLRRKVRLHDAAPRARERAAQRWGPRPAVALLRVEGTIAAGKSRRSLLAGRIAGGDTVAELVRRAANDPSVRALVVRVESPGGDALASDLIARELTLARRRGKPVVISMGDVAASGGYLVSTGADLIVAEPSTLTGSIGVFVVKPDLSGLLAKLGVNPVTVKRGARADLASTSRPWTAEERARVEREVRGFYDVFISRVADARRMRRDAVEAVASGQVWTGAQALERGLVDRLGSLEEAVRLAAERAGLGPERPEVKSFEPARSLLADLLPSSVAGAAEDGGELEALAGRVPELRGAALLLELGPLVALPLTWPGESVGSAP